ncbi:hypothetical protein SSPIM334S_05230 [Streptomyces spiroverticillatus]|uniref:hypothetical protein n=1 Tax=Streptomyces finlayi TaxID=67296 RepID=UPI0016756033|nr:hypothetical protein [Streptomyces finlayi]
MRQQEALTGLLQRAFARGELGTVPIVRRLHALLNGPVFATLYLQRADPAGLAEWLGPVAARAAREGGPPAAG